MSGEFCSLMEATVRAAVERAGERATQFTGCQFSRNMEQDCWEIVFCIGPSPSDGWLYSRIDCGTLYGMGMGRARLEDCAWELERLWWRFYEDRGMDQLIAQAREQFYNVMRTTTDHSTIEQARFLLNQTLQHIHQHHVRENLNRYLHDMVWDAEPVWPNRFTPDAFVQQRARALLLGALSVAQKQQFEASNYFMVSGSNGGIFRINYGRQMNIDQLHSNGNKICGWCFLPAGGLVEEDVMLAQKIALETDEKKALKVANRIGDPYRNSYQVTHYPGGVTWRD